MRQVKQPLRAEAAAPDNRKRSTASNVIASAPLRPRPLSAEPIRGPNKPRGGAGSDSGFQVAGYLGLRERP